MKAGKFPTLMHLAFAKFGQSLAHLIRLRVSRVQLKDALKMRFCAGTSFTLL